VRSALVNSGAVCSEEQIQRCELRFLCSLKGAPCLIGLSEMRGIL
jgi:hypothetical protein